MSNLIGQSLGRYHILEQIGEGGMATVYKAFDTRLERDVAIKIIRRGAFPPDQLERILKRFEREAKSLAKLSHPNIVGVIDYGEYEDAPYLVMEYLPGGTLKQRLGKPIPWQDAVRVLIPIAQALEYAHEHNLIHRDIKPSNILLTEKGQPMLTDFGIAKILETDETATLTGTGVGVGTPEYMAPEQWTGQSTQQSDVYSLGVVFYEMITSRKPYMADTPAALLLKQANDPLPRPRAFLSDLPDEVEKVLLKVLAKKPEDRYLDMGALTIAFENLLAGNIERKKVDAIRAIPSLPDRDKDDAATIDQTEEKSKAYSKSLPSSPHLRLPIFGIVSKRPRLLAGMVIIIFFVGILFVWSAVDKPFSHQPTRTPEMTLTPNVSETKRARYTEQAGTRTQSAAATFQVYDVTATGLARINATSHANATATAKTWIRVDAARGMQSSGVNVKTGQTVTIKYVSGFWFPWSGNRFDAGGTRSDYTYPDNIVQNCSHAALIAQIEKQTPYCVGLSNTRVSSLSGYIYLGINDRVLNDDSSAVFVIISIK